MVQKVLICAFAAQCKHKSWIKKTLKFYSFPKNDALRKKWIQNIAINGQGYEWSKSDRVCNDVWLIINSTCRFCYNATRGAIFFITVNCKVSSRNMVK